MSWQEAYERALIDARQRDEFLTEPESFRLGYEAGYNDGYSDGRLDYDHECP